MSEQVKRWAMWRAIEELGPDDWVVRDTCYDTLAQRCRELEVLLHGTSESYALRCDELQKIRLERDTLRAENVRLAEWYSEAGVREDTLRAEVEHLSVAYTDAVASHNITLDDLRVANEALAIAHNDASHYASTAADLRIEVSDLKARLLEAERGAEELVRLRAEDRCGARQYSDRMHCARCRLDWDANDPLPPECKP